MKTLLLKINPKRPERRKIEIAAKAIRDGRLVIFPTETVYGVGADAFNAKACRRIFRVKRRAADNPLIVHVSDMKMAKEVGRIPKRYEGIVRELWPAPLTFIVEAKKRLPSVVTANLDTVAIRMPAHKIANALIRESGVPIAAPSANISERPSSTRAAHAMKYFEGLVDIVIDSGKTKFGLESTVLDLDSFRLLRPGAFPVEKIEKAFGRRVLGAIPYGSLGYKGKVISPGMKYKHYSPETPLFLFGGDMDELKRCIAEYRKEGKEMAFIGSSEACNELGRKIRYKIRLGSGRKLSEVGRNLFDALIRLDSMKVDLAVVEKFSERGAGLAIMNRLRKASGHREFSDLVGFLKLLKSF